MAPLDSRLGGCLGGRPHGRLDSRVNGLLRQILVSLLSTARSTVTTYTFSSERVVYEKIPRGTRREVRPRVLFPEHTPMFHLVQYVVVGEAVPNGLLH